MRILQTTEAKTNFSSVIRDVQAGNEIAIAYGKSKQAVAVIVPYEQWKKSNKRELGTLENKGTVQFSKNFSMTDEELLHS